MVCLACYRYWDTKNAGAEQQRQSVFLKKAFLIKLVCKETQQHFKDTVECDTNTLFDGIYSSTALEILELCDCVGLEICSFNLKLDFFY